MNYESSVKEIDEITREVTVTIPADVVTQKIGVEIGNICKTVSVKGFRKGKAPRNIVERMHGERVRYEVAQKLISSSLHEIIQANALDVVGDPKIDISSFDAGKELSFQASISLFPSPTISGYDSFVVEAEKQEFSDKAVDDAIEQMRRSKASIRKLESRDTAQIGDVIEGQLLVVVEGQEQEQQRPEPLVTELGDGRLPEDLATAIAGTRIGETREIPTTFADDHADQSLRGKNAKYTFTLNALHERELPELNDDFVKTLGVEAQTLLELRLKVREDIEKNYEAEAKSDANAKILEELLKRNPFSVPQVMIDEEIRSLISRSGIFDSSKIDISKIPVEAFREQLGENAEKRVKTAIVIDQIGKLEKITVSDEELEKAFEEIAEANGLPLEEVKKFFRDSYRRAGFVAEQVRNKTLDFLLDRAKITYVAPKAKDSSAQDSEAKKPAKKAKKKTKAESEAQSESSSV